MELRLVVDSLLDKLSNTAINWGQYRLALRIINFRKKYILGDSTPPEHICKFKVVKTADGGLEAVCQECGKKIK